MLNTSSTSAASRGLPVLRPRPDQAQRWNSFTAPVPFTQAATSVLDAHAIDGQRSDPTS